MVRLQATLDQCWDSGSRSLSQTNINKTSTPYQHFANNPSNNIQKRNRPNNTTQYPRRKQRLVNSHRTATTTTTAPTLYNNINQYKSPNLTQYYLQPNGTGLAGPTTSNDCHWGDIMLPKCGLSTLRLAVRNVCTLPSQ
jgi:hypothetical protein